MSAIHKTPLLTEMIASYDEVTLTDFEIDCDSENKNETYSKTVDLLGHTQTNLLHTSCVSLEILTMIET